MGWFLLTNPGNATERLLQSFYQWGVYWLALGLLFEPYGGGIKKDPSTYSYYFIATAIAFFILIAFTVLIDVLKQRKWLQLLIDNGQNPMVAYVAFANLLWPILTLTQLEPIIVEHTNSPLRGFLKGVLYTLPIALVVSLCTRLKLFWRT
jgi:predicted acyltransferase